jgi:hypothetical protein
MSRPLRSRRFREELKAAADELVRELPEEARSDEHVQAVAKKAAREVVLLRREKAKLKTLLAEARRSSSWDQEELRHLREQERIHSNDW